MAASIAVKKSKDFYRVLAGMRPISTTTILLNDAFKNSKMLNKFLQKKQKKKSYNWNGPFVSEPVFKGLQEKGKKKGFSEGMQRRAGHINKIFFDTMTQIIGNGELDIYIDVTKVKIVPDFSGVSVYWEAKGTEEDVETERILQEKAGYLRTLMMKSNTLGKVPPITFVKDNTNSYIKELEHLFEVAKLQTLDETETADETESDVKSGIADELLQSEEKGLTQFEAEESHSSDKTDLPADKSNITLSEIEKVKDDVNIRQDLYGLNHDILMQKVIDMKTSSRNRSQMPVDFSDYGDANVFSGDVQRFGKEILGKSRAAEMKQLSVLLRKQKDKGKEIRFDDDADLDESGGFTDSEDLYDPDNALDNESDYELETSNVKDFEAEADGGKVKIIDSENNSRNT